MSDAVVEGGMGKRHLLALPREQIQGKEKEVLRKKKKVKTWKARTEKRC